MPRPSLVSRLGSLYLTLATRSGNAQASYAFAVTSLALGVVALLAATTAYLATHPSGRPKELTTRSVIFGLSHQQSHHRSGGIRACDLGKSRSGEHGHGPGKDGRPSHPSSA